MSIRETIQNAVKGDPEDVAERAQQNVAALRDNLTALDVRATELQEQIHLAKSEAQRLAGAVTDGGSRKAYDAAKAKVQELADELELNRDARSGKVDALSKAEFELFQAKAGDMMKVARRHANKRLKDGAQKVMDGIALAVEGWNVLHTEAEKLKSWGGPHLISHSGGLILNRTEIANAVSEDLARVSAPVALDTMATPAFPGSASTMLRGNHKAWPTIVEKMEEANASLLKVVEGHVVTPEPKPAKAEAPKPQTPVEQPAANAPRIDGNAMAMAMPHRKLEV